MPEPTPLCFNWGPSEERQERQFSPNAPAIATDKLAATTAGIQLHHAGCFICNKPPARKKTPTAADR